MAEVPFISYPGQVWATCWQAMDWLNGILADAGSNTTTLFNPAQAVFNTLWNGAQSVAAWQTGAVLTAEAASLASLPGVIISSGSAAYVSARIASVSAAATGISALPPVANPLMAVNLLTAGSPAIADPLFLEFCMQFDAESYPVGMTSATFIQSAVAEAQAWLDETNAIGVLQGPNLTSAYDVAARMYRCSFTIASGILSLLPSGPPPGLVGFQPLFDGFGNPLTDGFGQILYSAFPNTQTQFVWNSIVALPTILLDASALFSPPSTLINQQCGVIRYALLNYAAQLSQLLLSLRVQTVNQPTTALLQNQDTLMDLAARQTGDFSEWSTIAAINRLQPPFPGPTNPALALSGTPLFMPGSAPPLNPNATLPTYAANVLGIDYDFGPINGVQPSWLGDISLISGLTNYRRALGRRLQTTLGTLLYHRNYGSRIPPEVGAIQSTDEAARLAQYGKSALAADPRTANVLTAIATVQPGFLASFSGAVSPIGFGTTSVQINEVIGANP